MSSRKQLANRPFKHRQKQQPGYYRQYAYTEEGNPVDMNGDSFIASGPELTPEEKSVQAYRDLPNRALKRKAYAEARKKNEQ